VNSIGTRRGPDPLRIALLTLESTASADAVAAFARAQRERLVLVGRSDPYRRAAGGMPGQLWRHLRRSGPGLLPWLALEFTLPRLLSAVRADDAGSLAALCREGRIPVATVQDVNGPDFHAALREARADLIVTFHFDQILAAATIALAPLGGINVHPSLLPRHRGPMPVFWAMREDPRLLGVTVHRLVPRIDSGAVLAQRAMPLPPGLSVATAARALHGLGAGLTSTVVEAIETGKTAARDMTPLPYCPFPPRAALRDAARRGLRLVDRSDLKAARSVRL
jgi:folate-dependent phosphoribosylglycinamide formyltransferase PurN